MWKIQDFSVIQILREINLSESRSPFRGAENGEFGKLQPSKSAKVHKNQNSEPLSL